MKRLSILTLMFLLFLRNLPAQTYVAPILGYHFSKNTGYSTEAFPWNDVISDHDFGSRYPLFGIGIRQRISGRIGFDLTGSYTRQFVKYSDSGIVGYSDLKFNSIGIFAVPNFRIFNQCFLGFGLGYHALRQIALGKKDRDIWVDWGERYNQEQWGWVATMGYQYRSIFLELRFLDSVSKNTHTRHFIKQTQSAEICLGYRFKVLDKITWKRPKTICNGF